MLYTWSDVATMVRKQISIEPDQELPAWRFRCEELYQQQRLGRVSGCSQQIWRTSKDPRGAGV
jgi:hypothetical protein